MLKSTKTPVIKLAKNKRCTIRKTAKQKRLLSQLQRNSTFAIFQPIIKNSALRAIHNAPAVVERINAYKMKDANGNDVKFTVEDLTKGVDLHDRKSIARALKTNDILRTIAVMDATGQLVMKTGAFAEASLSGINYATQDDLNYFAKNADSQTFAEVSKALNITPEEWRTMTPESFNLKMEAYSESDIGKSEIERIKAITKAKKIPESEAKEKLPISPITQKNGSIKRYKTDKVNIAIIKEDSQYTIYDYDSKQATRRLSLAEVQSEIEKLKGDSARFAMNYESDIDALDKGTFDVRNNTHLRVLEHTPEIFIEKAGAKDRPIVMSWDVAFLSMKDKKETAQWYRDISRDYNEALDKGHYHNLGSDALKSIPKSLQDPLYIVKQDNGRLCAITEILHKGKRPVFAVVELEAYTVTTDKGAKGSDIYNLIVTVSDGQPNYLENTILSKDILYNKNKEEPAHFISRLKSLKKLMPKNDLADSSNNIISNPDEKINPSDEKNLKADNSDKNSIAEEYKKAEEYAKANIPEYNKLYAPAKRAVERTIVEARANGVSDADVLTFAKFSTKSGINVAFDKQMLICGVDENGKIKYSDGLFDGDNTIFINKDSKRRYSAVLLHELMHSLNNNTSSKAEYRIGKKLIRATKKMDPQRKKKIEDEYKKYYESVGAKLTDEILVDELLAHYTEDVMGDIDVLEFLEGEVQGLGKRIIGFFNESARRYSGDENLSREARKYARKFRELYRQIEQRHKGMNATEGVNSGERRALDIDNLTEEQYNNFGWVRANDILTADEYKNFTTEFAKAKTSGEYDAYKSSLGEYMIAVGEQHGAKEGVKNRIVFAKGDIESPQITRVLKIAKNNETQLSEIRSDVNAIERSGLRQETGGIFTLYTRFDVADYVSARKNLRQGKRYNNQLGANRGTGSRTTQKTVKGTRSPLTLLVHTFKDITGRTKTVIKVDSQYLVEGNARANLYNSIDEAVEAHNKNIIRRYADKYNTIPSRVKAKLQTDPDFLAKEWKRGRRAALDLDNLPDTTETEELPNTLNSVAKEKVRYKGRIFDTATKFYMETVDELYGLQRYLETAGKKQDAAAIVNMARSSRSQAQTMIGSVQYDLFSGNYEELGEGIQKILEPITKRTKGETTEIRRNRVEKFNDYMLHRMNVDRMTLEERSNLWHLEDVEELESINENLKKAQEDYEAAKTELDKLKGVKGEDALLERKKLRNKMSKAKGYTKHLKKQIKPYIAPCGTVILRWSTAYIPRKLFERFLISIAFIFYSLYLSNTSEAFFASRLCCLFSLFLFCRFVASISCLCSRLCLCSPCSVFLTHLCTSLGWAHMCIIPRLFCICLCLSIGVVSSVFLKVCFGFSLYCLKFCLICLVLRFCAFLHITEGFLKKCSDSHFISPHYL